jgi:hypothetical protein
MSMLNWGTSAAPVKFHCPERAKEVYISGKTQVTGLQNLTSTQPSLDLFPLSTRRNCMPTKKKSSSRRKYGKGASKSVESAMRRKKSGTLRSGKSGKGGKVKSRKQAIAIGLSEARKKGAKVPKKK